jgi:glyoxylase-like metal-dependent hydrolase (beta-lactamase superfamily II)
MIGLSKRNSAEIGPVRIGIPNAGPTVSMPPAVVIAPTRLTALTTLVVAAAATSLAAQRAAAPQTLIDRAARAMGGPAALDSLRTKTTEFNTVAFGLGQEETPLSPARATFILGRTTIDYAGTRLLTVQEVRLVTGVVNRERRVTLPTMALVESNGRPQLGPAAIAANLERNLSLQLERIILAAVHHGSVASALRPKPLRGEVADGIRMPLGPDTVDLWFDRASGLPVATETTADDDILGDRRTRTWYTRWQPAGAVVLPRQVDVEVNGRLLSHTVVTAAAVNQPLDDGQFAIPDSLAGQAPRPPAGPPAIIVTLANLAPGVWRAEGGSHHSLVVEQASGLLVIEAPQSRARVAALLDSLRSRFPRQRVTGVVLTHHHHDHSGGIRAAQARGIPVIAHHRNTGFVRDVAGARKTVAPDRLSRGSAPPRVIPVRDSMVMGSGAGRVVLYPLASSHAEGLLAAWVPSAGVVFTSDVLSPAANQPLPRIGSLELATFARARGIAPSRFAGGHGTVVEWSMVEAAGR